MHRLTFGTHRIVLWAYQLMPIAIAFLLTTSSAYGLELSNRSISIANNSPSANTQYTISFGLTAAETLGSIKIQFCSNSPIIYITCDAPSNFDDLNANLVSQTGISGFSINSSLSNNYTLVLSRAALIANASQLTFIFSNISNPSTPGPFYAKFQTFASSDTSGSATDIGGDAMYILNPYSISATVPPYLLFCVGVSIPNSNCSQSEGSLINFGTMSPNYTVSAQSQMLVATNAQSGYSIEISGNTMTSGNNILPPITNDNVSLPGTSQFGINLVANNRPTVGLDPSGSGTGNIASNYSVPNLFKFSNGDVLAQSNNVSSFKTYTISYILNMAKNQPPGIYSTTISFIGMAFF